MDSSDLRNQLDQTKEGSEANDDAEEQADETEPEPVIEETPEGDKTATTDNDRSEEQSPTTDDNADDDQQEGTEKGPAFSTQESDKISIYPHQNNTRSIRVICNSVENDLLALGHDDFEVREAHDAMVQLANEHPREVTQLVLEARGLDPDAVEDLP
jgi:hypothetical protein